MYSTATLGHPNDSNDGPWHSGAPFCGHPRKSTKQSESEGDPNNNASDSVKIGVIRIGPTSCAADQK